MTRDDPGSWIAPPESEWTESDSLKVGLLVRNNWKMRSAGAEGIGTEPFLVEAIASHRAYMAEKGRLAERRTVKRLAKDAD